jgi:hypothetical protein
VGGGGITAVVVTLFQVFRRAAEAAFGGAGAAAGVVPIPAARALYNRGFPGEEPGCSNNAKEA